MKSSVLFISLTLGFLGIACGGEDSPMDPDNGMPCNLTISAFTLPAADPGPFSVVYNAQVVSGTGTITQVTYLDGAGTSQNLSNPTLPWSMSFTTDPGNDVSMSSQGRAARGRALRLPSPL